MTFELAGHASCPECGNQDLKGLPERDHIERFYSSPISRIQGLFGAKLYHCIFCRLQFYDWRPRLEAAEIERRRRQFIKPGPKIQPEAITPPPVLQAPFPPVETPKQVEQSEPQPPSDHRPASAVISEGVRVSGQVSSTKDLYVDGEIDGSIELLGHNLTLGPSAKVRAKIHAGDIKVEDGAYFKGSVDIGEPDGRRVGSQKRKAAAAKGANTV